jgi:ERCC4-related helicase
MVGSTAPSVGALVRVRQRTFLVEDVQLPPGGTVAVSPVVSLACVEDDALGQKLSVLWDAEVDARVLPSGRSAIRSGAKPDEPSTFAAYLHALKWGCVTSTDPTLFQSPLRAGIVPKTYQLEPLRKALSLPRVNLFIADDVGLGKTIEAGLVLQELLLRQRVDRVVVACPASVLLQWRDELNQRFGLSFVVFDKAFVNARRRERGFGVNAWATHRFFIISHNLLRNEEYLGGLRDWLGAFSPGTLLILDEAHAAAPASESKYAIDSQTTHAVRDISHRFEHRLFLSATPHNGHSNSFSALLEILDPQRFTRGVPVRKAARNVVMVRRLKGEIREHVPGEQIPIRHVEPHRIKGLPTTAPELVLAEKLAAYSELLEQRVANSTNRTKAAAKLVTIALQKRLLSSVEAFARTLAVHRQGAAKTFAEAAATVTAQIEIALQEGADVTEQQAAALDDAQIAASSKAAAEALDTERAKQLLNEMTDLAEKTRSRPDAKVGKLVDWIREHQCPRIGQRGADWLPARMLIFTEYTDSKTYLVEQLSSVLAGSDRAEERILTLHGGMDEEERERVKAAFNDAHHPVRILVATDAAREGVNLQAQCSNLFHFDLPWNPARLEQRNGRIDRLLQPEPHVYCHYFIYEQRPEDVVLTKLVEKTETIYKELGSLSDVIEEQVSRSFKGGISRAKLDALRDEIDGAGTNITNSVAKEELEDDRDALAENFDRLRKLYDKAIDNLGGDAERLKTELKGVVDVGLRLSGCPPLTARTEPPHTFDVPPMDKLAPGDVSWREIMDTLRAPRTRKVAAWQWRAENPPRPISFEPATTLSSDTVQLHLQHKLTQRALAQFRSQAFGEDRLSRVCIVRDPSTARPRVLALGRLSVYGPGASRLHEELLVVAAFRPEGNDPSKLKAFVEDSKAEEKALEALFGVLARDNQAPVPERLTRTLMEAAAQDEDALWSTLQTRAEKRIEWARDQLSRRAKKEGDEMIAILEAQRGSIDKELKRRTQTAFQFHEDERTQRKQFELDTRHIESRRGAIEHDIEEEPERIRQLYEVKHHRLERVGLVYLWPERG